MNRTTKLFTMLSITAMMFLSLLTTQIQAQTAATSFSGDATGVIANATVGTVATVNAQIAPTGALPSVGGRRTNGVDVSTIIDLDGPLTANAFLSTGIVTTRTSGGPAGVTAGDPGAGLNTSQSQAVVNNLNLNIAAVAGVNAGLSVTADTITANTSCVCGPACTGNSIIEDLRVNGLIVSNTGLTGTTPFVVVSGNVTTRTDVNGNVFLEASPGAQISVLNGTVILTLNEQIGAGTGNITVNALRIQTANLLGITTDIIVAQAHSDITCATGGNLGTITVTKGFCNRVNTPQNTCNGTPPANTIPTTVTFTFTPVGSGTTGTIIVPIDTGNGNGTSAAIGGFSPDFQVLVCEVVPDGFVSTPRPSGTTGGGNQTSSGNCILTNVGTGNRVVDFLNSPAAPTAANVSVSGRVLSSNGRGISNVVVSLTGQNGDVQTARTNPFGYYSFANVDAGEIYFVNASSKRYRFDTQTVTPMQNLAEVNFIAQPANGSNIMLR